MIPAFQGPRRLPPVLVLGLGGLLGLSSLVGGSEVAGLVRGHGLPAVDPSRPAVDFLLPRLGGGELSLSEFAGRWVILTFWASWCGPCRSEMPSLEALHRSHSAKGLTVLGVSVDRDAGVASSFVEEHGLSFPQGWDEQGGVGATYQATAIPVSYLIDPEGALIAVSRGARDWTRLATLFDALIAYRPPEVDTQAVYAEALEMPGVSDPPSAEVVISENSPAPGREFFLDVRLRWSGRVDEYLPQPPRVHLPEGVVQKGVAATTSSRDGAQVVVYRITLQSDRDAVGSYALDPVELRYRPRWASDVATTRVPGPTITVAPRTVVGLRPGSLAALSTGLVAVVLAGLVVARRRRARRRRRPIAEDHRFERLWSRFQEARSRRLQGDAAASGLILVELLIELREAPTESESVEMAELSESLRFGGHLPSVADLDRMQREVSRGLEALRPDPDRAARAAIRLQEDEERS